MTPKPAFSSILRPSLERALGQFREAAERAGLPAAVLVAGLEPVLATRLSFVAGPTLFDVFEPRRPAPPPLAALLDETPSDVSRAAYDAFAGDMAKGGLERLLVAHPGLAHSIDTLLDNTLAAALELAKWLRDDSAALCAFVPGWAAGVPALAAVDFGLSDPHAEGRAVAGLRFADGTKLACKPRSLAVEAGFERLVCWLRARDPSLPDQRLPRLLECGDHGWMEWVAPADCRDTGEVAAFYRRLGMLAACLRLLRGTDIHSENLIAAGAYPVMVDLECLFAPDLGPGWLHRLHDLPAYMESGLLPVLVPMGEGQWRNMGSGGPPFPPVAVPNFGFRHAGTDWMDRATNISHPAERNLPRLDGVEQDIRAHAPAMVEAYRRTLAVVLAHRDAFLSAEGPLAGFAAARCRYVALPTESYRRLLVRLHEPDMTAAPDALDRQAARISRPSIGLAAPDWQRLLAAEKAALGRLDVPAFLYRPGDAALAEAGGTAIGRLSALPPLETARQAVRDLSPLHIEREAAVLDRIFIPAPPVPTDDLVAGILDWIAGRAVPRADGGVDWVRPYEEPPITFRIAGHGLYHGNAGIALVLAAAARQRGRNDWADLARCALLPLRHLARDETARDLAQALGVGHAVGLGGMIAALCWAGDLLDDPACLAEAAWLAARLGDPDSVQAFDLYDGIAGLLPALHLLAGRTGDPGLRSLMAGWADRLLALSVEEEGMRLWHPRRGKPVAGLAHGQGGMAVALACAFEATGQERYLAAAQQALLWEDRLFDAETGNWPEPVRRGRPTTAWCHGAPGVALSRLALLKLAPEAFAGRRAELARALETTAAQGPEGSGDLCCGLAGRLSILALAGQDATALRAAALRRWGGGDFGLWSGMLPVEFTDPCLFKGLAGLAYALLATEAPGIAPPVLLPI
ncbi:MAG: type 2 lantipeptide synthetase LanM family protein [Alphaproteobacteria bacterium]|nr:type 2 lantipeptide synthetase LanM family protein [Alphaproteobacteria bacterium]MBU0797218.1 type 2 lantipeptide synthetase LanM family protein [Alphaproteobacteria bacterium]MBU1814014.1 type 2 lantipeptide synthetase LanM family protein [Alphaproteobacteria bacterium]